MMSFDISSLFTNVPLNETVIKQRLTDHPELLSSNVPVIEAMSTDEVCSLILMTVQNVDFKFDGSFFRQIDGIAMGTPLGPILADLFLASLESGSMSPIINKATLYASYIHDTFLLLNQDQNP